MASRGAKRSKPTEATPDDMLKQQLQNDIFRLQYLNNTMNYIIPNKQSHSYYLDVDTNLLDTIIHGDLNTVSLHCIDRVKSMKENCDENLYVKELQECGDFVNYDYPKEYRYNIRTIEDQLKEEKSKQEVIKRIRHKYPYAPQHMTSSELNLWLDRYNDSLLEAYMVNSLMVSEDRELPFESSINIQDLFKKPELPNQERYSMKGGGEVPVRIQAGISSKLKAVESEGKERKGEKGKKIAKKTEFKHSSLEEYRPKPTKKSLKYDLKEGELEKAAFGTTPFLVQTTEKKPIGQNERPTINQIEVKQVKTDQKNIPEAQTKNLKRKFIKKKDGETKEKVKPSKVAKPKKDVQRKKDEKQVEQKVEEIAHDVQKLPLVEEKVEQKNQTTIGLQVDEQNKDVKHEGDRIVVAVQNKAIMKHAIEPQKQVEGLEEEKKEEKQEGEEPAIEIEPLEEQIQENDNFLGEGQIEIGLNLEGQGSRIFVPPIIQSGVSIEGPSDSNRDEEGEEDDIDIGYYLNGS